MEQRKSIKVITSIPLTVGTLLLIICGYAPIIHCVIVREQQTISIVSWVIVIACSGILPTLALIFSSRFLFSIITIGDKGVSRALFGRLFKIEISWDELKEIWFYQWVFPYIWLSKDPVTEKTNYYSLIKKKNIIYLKLSKKVYSAITQYIDKPIEGLPSNVEEKLKSKK